MKTIKIGKFGKLFSFILLALMLVSNVFADDFVKITPNPAYDRDNLSCTYNNLNSGYKFKWFVNGNEAGLTNTLSADKTNAGDNIKCEVYSFGPGGNVYLGEDSITILADPVAPTNRAPIVNINFPADNYRDVAGANIDFFGSASDPDGDAIATSWNFGDGAVINNDLSAEHVFANPGTYNVTLIAVDDKGAVASDSVNVIIMENYYGVVNLTAYSNKYINEANTFYRANPFYAKFNVVDRSGSGVSGLEVDAYLLNMQTGAHLDLSAYTGFIDSFTLILNGEPLLNSAGTYYFKLDNIPISDEFLGENTVLVIAYDNQNRAGRSEKEIIILNNPLSFNALPDLTFSVGNSVSIDLDNYASDIETSDSQIAFGVTEGIKINAVFNRANHVLTFTSDIQGAAETFTISADDRDGSVVLRTIRVSVEPGYDYNTLDRSDKYAYMHGVPHNFEFEFVKPLVYQQTYKAGSNVKMLVEIANKGSVNENLEIKAYIPGTKQYQTLGNLHINAGQNAYLNEVVSLPRTLNSGVHVMQIIAYNSDNVQKTSYWVFNVQH